MYPILLEFGDIKLPSWHVFYVLGAFASYYYLLQIRRKVLPKISEIHISRLFVLCYFAGYFGARILSILIEQVAVWQSAPIEILSELLKLGPMTFYGGLIASVFVGLVYSLTVSLPVDDVLDASIPAGFLALSIGRIGCFMNGDDFGKPVSIGSEAASPWWSVTFPNLQDGITRYPVQLIEAFCAALIVILATINFRFIRNALRPGAIGFICLIIYANIRFFLEFIRGDFRGFVFGTWLSTSQFISLIILLACAGSLPFWLKTPTRSRDN